MSAHTIGPQLADLARDASGEFIQSDPQALIVAATDVAVTAGRADLGMSQETALGRLLLEATGVALAAGLDVTACLRAGARSLAAEHGVTQRWL